MQARDKSGAPTRLEPSQLIFITLQDISAQLETLTGEIKKLKSTTLPWSHNWAATTTPTLLPLPFGWYSFVFRNDGTADVYLLSGDKTITSEAPIKSGEDITITLGGQEEVGMRQYVVTLSGTASGRIWST